MKDEFYAHSMSGKPPEDWHRLDDHLKKVAELARKFAEDFQSEVKFRLLETRRKGGELAI